MFASSAATYFNAPILQFVLQEYNALWITSHSQLAIVLGEYGYIGVILWYVLFLGTYRILKAARQAARENGFWRGVVWGALGFWVLFLLGSVTSNIWETQFASVTFWAMMAILYRYKQIAQAIPKAIH
jgi:hypothetical protein